MDAEKCPVCGGRGLVTLPIDPNGELESLAFAELSALAVGAPVEQFRERPTIQSNPALAPLKRAIRVLVHRAVKGRLQHLH